MELVQYQDYEEYKKAMNTVLNRTGKRYGYLKEFRIQQCKRIRPGGIQA